MNISLTFYFCFCAFRSVTFCISIYSFTFYPAICVSLSFFQLLMPLRCTSRFFSTPHLQHFFGRSISPICLYLFVIKCIWTLSQIQLLNNHFNPFFGEKNICCLFNFIGLLDGSTTQWRRSPTHHNALHPAGEAIHSWKTKKCNNKKKLYPPSSVFHG